MRQTGTLQKASRLTAGAQRHPTCAPPEGWCSMMRLLGSDMRCPVSPAHSSRLAMDAAWPMHRVEMGLLTYCRQSEVHF